MQEVVRGTSQWEMGDAGTEVAVRSASGQETTVIKESGGGRSKTAEETGEDKGTNELTGRREAREAKTSTGVGHQTFLMGKAGARNVEQDKFIRAEVTSTLVLVRHRTIPTASILN